jgi:hypothetical protein
MTEPVRFGLNVDPNTGGLPIAERITAIADAGGLEYVGIQDHPYNAEFVDTLTMITWLAGRTRARAGRRGAARPPARRE